MDSRNGAILGLFFRLEIEEISISENKRNLRSHWVDLSAKSCKFLHQFFLQIFGRHFESAAMNGTCFQDPTEFIKFSISPEFVPLLMDKDLLCKIFVLLLGIKQELYAKSFQVNDIRENLSHHVENARG